MAASTAIAKINFATTYCSKGAHNTIEIEGFDVIREKPYGSGLRRTSTVAPGIHRVSGQVRYPGLVHARSIDIALSEFLIVWDQLKTKEPRRATLSFKFESDFELVSNRPGLQEISGDFDFPILVSCDGDNNSAQAWKEDWDVMRGFTSHRDGEILPALQLGFDFETQNQQIVTILALGNESLASARRYLSNAKAPMKVEG